MICPDAPPKNIPEIFDRVEIRGTRWPDHPGDLMLPQEVGDEACPMRRGIVILEDGVLTEVGERW